MIWLFVLALARAEMPAMEEFPRKLSLTLGIATQNFDFDVKGPTDVDYAPNVSTLTTFGVNYAGIGGFTYGTRQAIDEENRNKGTTRYDDFRFNFPFRRFAVLLYYARYYGLYVSNSSGIDSSLPKSAPYLLYPNMYAQNMGGSFTWVWNPDRFSIAAVQDMSERQIKSGGSVLVGASATETFFRNDGPILPAKIRATYERDAEMNEGRLRALSLKGGYGYTEVYRRRYFATISASIGIGGQEVSISTPTEDYVLKRASYNLYEAHIGLGFNGDRFFGGLNAYYGNNDFRAAVAQITTRYAAGGFIFGARL